MSTYSRYLHNAKKTKKTVLSLFAKGVKQIEIARRCDLSRQRVNQIVHPERNRARAAITRLTGSGKLAKAAKLKCVDCGKKAKEYDHPDYKKPLFIEPVCETCHTKRTKHWMKDRSGNKYRRDAAAMLVNEFPRKEITYRQFIKFYVTRTRASKMLRIPESTIAHWARAGIPLWRQAQIERAHGGKMPNGKLRAAK